MPESIRTKALDYLGGAQVVRDIIGNGVYRSLSSRGLNPFALSETVRKELRQSRLTQEDLQKVCRAEYVPSPRIKRILGLEGISPDIIPVPTMSKDEAHYWFTTLESSSSEGFNLQFRCRVIEELG